LIGLDEVLSILNYDKRIGLDIGSRSTKAAVESDGILLGICDTPDFLEALGKGKLQEAKDVVTTGYGRHMYGSLSIPEIRAHTTGVVKSLELDDCTILDIGGQDFKVIRVEKKAIRDFTMNDKCAAGTGRFLEKMSDILAMPLDELGSHRGGRKILESTCSVFTETEIISLMMEGVGRDELAEGVIHSVYERIRPYLRMYPMDMIVMTGGVSSFKGLRDTFSSNLEVEVMVPEKARFMGALGCMWSTRG
jgi:predicted CoA-substrate-specific enzyme activase